MSVALLPQILQSVAKYLNQNVSQTRSFLRSKVMLNIVTILVHVAEGSLDLDAQQTRDSLKLGDAIISLLLPETDVSTNMHLQRTFRDVLSAVGKLNDVSAAQFAQYIVGCLRAVHPPEGPSTTAKKASSGATEAKLDRLVRALKAPVPTKPTLRQLLKHRELAQSVMQILAANVDGARGASAAVESSTKSSASIPQPDPSLGVTVTPEDEEVINTLSGQFTKKLESFAAEREAALVEHKDLLVSSRERIAALAAERTKLVSRLRLVDKELADLAEGVREAESATERVNAKHDKQVAELEDTCRGDLDRVRTAVARRDATASITKLIKSLSAASDSAREKEAAAGAAADAAASGAHMDSFFRYAARYFETEVACVRSLRAQIAAGKRKAEKDEVCHCRFVLVLRLLLAILTVLHSLPKG